MFEFWWLEVELFRSGRVGFGLIGLTGAWIVGIGWVGFWVVTMGLFLLWVDVIAYELPLRVTDIYA